LEGEEEKRREEKRREGREGREGEVRDIYSRPGGAGLRLMIRRCHF